MRLSKLTKKNFKLYGLSIRAAKMAQQARAPVTKPDDPHLVPGEQEERRDSADDL